MFLTDEAVVELATRAADEIETRGLAQGRMMDPDGRVCAQGAMILAQGEPEDALRTGSFHGRREVQRTVLALSARLGRLIPGCPRWGYSAVVDIPAWNNAAGRSADEVVAALRALAQAHDVAAHPRAPGPRLASPAPVPLEVLDTIRPDRVPAVA